MLKLSLDEFVIHYRKALFHYLSKLQVLVWTQTPEIKFQYIFSFFEHIFSNSKIYQLVVNFTESVNYLLFVS